MPTAKPRHALTQTAELEAALAVAARRWPADSGRPSRLLLRLIETGRERIETELGSEAERRRAAVQDASGALTGVYEQDEAGALREDWPA